MKKYRFAIANYTEGLKQKCGNKDIDASLHLNRAAAHFHLSNYRLQPQLIWFVHRINSIFLKLFRSSLNDSLLAAKLKPDYFKAVFRATECCLKLKRYSDGLEWCDYGLRLDSNSEALVKIRTELVQGHVIISKNFHSLFVFSFIKKNSFTSISDFPNSLSAITNF